MTRFGALASLVVLTGCGGSASTVERVSEKRPAAASAAPVVSREHLPVLPPQGLLARARDDTLLVGLDGHVYGRLRGLQPLAESWSKAPERPLLRDARWKRFVLDLASRRVRPVRPSDARNSDPALPRRGCRVVWRMRGRVRGLCGDWKSPLLAAVWARPSPDGRYLLMQVPYACAASYAVIAPVADPERARTVDGRREVSPHYSEALGWTRDGRAVAYIHAHAEGHTEGCGGGPPGVYLVDPQTFERDLVYRGAATMWGAFPATR